MNTAVLFYNYLSAWDAGINDNASEAVHTLAREQGFKVVRAIPQSIADGWEFFIEFDVRPALPSYISFRITS